MALRGGAVAAAGLLLAGCAGPSAAPPVTSTQASPTVCTKHHQAVLCAHGLPSALPAQPFAGATGAGDQLVLQAHGVGPRSLEPAMVTGSSLYFEVACQGAGDVLVGDGAPLFRVGPCRGGSATSTTVIGGEQGKRLHLSIAVAPATRWELYVTETFA